MVRNSSAGDDGTTMFKESELKQQAQQSAAHQNVYGFQDVKGSKKTAAQSYSDHFEPMQHHYSSIDPNLTIYKKEANEAGHNGHAKSNKSQPKRLMKTKAPLPMKVADLNSMVQLRKKKPRMKFTEKMQYREQRERQIFSQQAMTRAQLKQQQRVLDGFLLLYSCRVKLPHEAIRSKLSSEYISEVQEEDLEFFKNLTYLDLSDNQVKMHSLANLSALEELDLQYNQIDSLSLSDEMFPELHTLHLSYNRIPKDHLFSLGNLKSLQVLNLASNNLGSLPMNLSFLQSLQELNLAANNFVSDATRNAGPAIFKALSTIPLLRKLNLSRNRFAEFHSELLPERNGSLPFES